MLLLAGMCTYIDSHFWKVTIEAMETWTISLFDWTSSYMYSFRTPSHLQVRGTASERCLAPSTGGLEPLEREHPLPQEPLGRNHEAERTGETESCDVPKFL